MTDNISPNFGTGDTSFQAAGGIEGIQQLVDDFYKIMDTLDAAKNIRAMHPDDLTISIDKLARFLCAWLGGPKRFSEKYGPISIPKAHAHLNVDNVDRDAWLLCMQIAIEKQTYKPDFSNYLIKELATPANRIVQFGQAN